MVSSSGGILPLALTDRAAGRNVPPDPGREGRRCSGGGFPQPCNDLLKPLLRLAGDRRNSWIANDPERGLWIHHLDNAPAVILIDDDIAREQEPDIEFSSQGTVGKRRIAGAEDNVRTEIRPQLLLHRLSDIDLGQDAEALLLKRGLCPLDRRRVRNGEMDAEAVADLPRGGHNHLRYHRGIDPLSRAGPADGPRVRPGGAPRHAAWSPGTHPGVRRRSPRRRGPERYGRPGSG